MDSSQRSPVQRHPPGKKIKVVLVLLSIYYHPLSFSRPPAILEPGSGVVLRNEDEWPVVRKGGEAEQGFANGGSGGEVFIL